MYVVPAVTATALVQVAVDGPFMPPKLQVISFDAVPVQPVEPRLAWDEAVAVLRHLNVPTDAHSCPVPPEWPALVDGVNLTGGEARAIEGTFEMGDVGIHGCS